MKICFTGLAILFFLTSTSQEHTYRQTDSLKKELQKISADTSRILMLSKLSEAFRSAKPDTALIIAEEALSRSRKINYIKGEIRALLAISVLHREKGDVPYALELALKGMRMADENKLIEEQIWGRIRLANVYIAIQDHEKGITYLNQSDSLLRRANNDFFWDVTHLLLSNAYIQQNNTDSASYQLKLLDTRKRSSNDFNMYLFMTTGNLHEKNNHFSAALDYYRKSIQICLLESDHRTTSTVYNNMAAIYKKKGMFDSAIYYAKEGLRYAEMLSYQNRIFTSSKLLAELYERTNPGEAVRYYKIAAAANDSIYGPRKVQQLQVTTIKEQERKQEAESKATEYQNKVRQYTLLAGLAVFLFIAIILFRNNNQRKKAYELLKKQTAETEQQKTMAEKALEELKNAQALLVQSEKMASLGELTAGIAHEIQNPLNFVNNFSEVNIELIDELKGERLKAEGIRNAKLEQELLDDLQQNLEKINHHGKRADAIVKGMLQHSRSSSGKKERTDINALVDEYLRLSYHGLRAKDKSFNADIKTDFDGSMGNIEIIPQDMGRVLLNLYNNAFYSVNEKRKLEGGKFNPIVEVVTKRIIFPSETSRLYREGNGGIEIIVKDNGTGIPQKVLDKIFQPFFTTKPSGQGTGLGLSMSYDIIKAHGGELKVETREGEGSTFIIQLPNHLS